MAKSKTDAQIIARLKREAPEVVLEREVDFDAMVTRILSVTPKDTDLSSGKPRKTSGRKRERTGRTPEKRDRDSKGYDPNK
jgi:hypothetical protein